MQCSAQIHVLIVEEFALEQHVDESDYLECHQRIHQYLII